MPTRFALLLAIAAAAILPAGCQSTPRTVQLDRPPAAKRGQTPPAASSEIQQTGGESEPRLVELSQRDGAPRDSTWTRLLGRFGKPQRIPLPRTDLEPNPEALAGEAEPAIGAF